MIGCLVLLFFLSICILLACTIPTALKRRATKTKDAEIERADDQASTPLLSDMDAVKVSETAFQRSPINPNLSATPEEAMPLLEGVPYFPPLPSPKGPTPPPLVTYYAPQDEPKSSFAPDAPTGTLPVVTTPPARPPDARYPPPPAATIPPPPLNTYYMVRQSVLPAPGPSLSPTPSPSPQGQDGLTPPEMRVTPPTLERKKSPGLYPAPDSTASSDDDKKSDHSTSYEGDSDSS